MVRATKWRILCGVLAIAVMVLFYNAPARADLLAFFDFNDASDAEVAVDASGNGNDGDVLEPAEYTAGGEGRTGAANDRAMDFGDFDNDAWIEIPSAFDGAFESMVDNDAATLTMWIFGGDDQPVDQWTWYVGAGRQLGSHIPWGNGTIYFDVAGCCGDNQRINLDAGGLDLYAGEWNHYAFVKNEDYTAIYQNGELFHDSDAQGGPKDPLSGIDEVVIGAGPAGDRRSYHGLIDEFGIWDTALTEEEINDVMENGLGGPGECVLQAGDANMDLQFNQADIVQVSIAAKYLTGQAANWGEGDWDGAPGGTVGDPPAGDGQFNQLDIISALNADQYLKGQYCTPDGAAAIAGGGAQDEQTSIIYDATTGEVGVDAPASTNLTSINIDSAAGIFANHENAQNLDGSFDTHSESNIFKATFGDSFGDISFGLVATAGLSQAMVEGDLTVIGSLEGGGGLGDVDLIYVPEPATMVLLGLGLAFVSLARRRR